MREIYAYRIREIQLEEGMTRPEIVFLEHLFASGLFRNLSNMERLSVAISGQSDRLVPYIGMMISPKLVELSFYLHYASIDEQAGRHLQTLVASLPIQAKRLRALKIDTDAGDPDQDFALVRIDQPWSFTRCLVKGALGLSNTLMALTATGMAVGPADFLNILSEATSLTSLSLWVKGPANWEVQQRVPTKLGDLSFRVTAFWDAIDLVNVIHLTKLVSFKLQVTTDPTEIHDRALASSLQESVGHSASLSHVGIEVHGESDDHVVLISADFLMPFLAFENMEKFTITSPTGIVIFDFDAGFLHAVSRSWLKLQTLTLLRTSWWPAEWRPLVRLNDLLEFILANPSLLSVGIDVDFDADINGITNHWYAEVNTASSSEIPLLFIEVGLALAKDPVVIAAHLSETLTVRISIRSLWLQHRFELNAQEVNRKNAMDWEDVETHIKAFQIVRLLVEDRLRGY